MIKNDIKSIINRIYDYPNENNKLLYFLKKLGVNEKHEILDVGCGYGRLLDLLTKKGLNVFGVDVNHQIIQKNREAGLQCMTVEEFSETGKKYDVLIMFHIIEHFPPKELLTFMDSYLDKLKIGGHLIIATPLMTKYFYDDFDHIKPYYPKGIEMVFSENSAQVQFYSRNKLILKRLWYKKYYFRFVHKKSLYIKTPVTKMMQFIAILSAIIFKVSGGVLGKKDGWMGIYQKIT